MATIGDWQREFERMSAPEMKDMADHIGYLLQWPFFKEAYKGLGLEVVKHMLREKANAADRVGRFQLPPGGV